MTETSQKFNPVTWFFNYVREAKEELKKVTWPSKQEVIKYSVVVISISIFIATFFSILDWGLNIGLEQLIILTS